VQIKIFRYGFVLTSISPDFDVRHLFMAHVEPRSSDLRWFAAEA